MKILKKTFKIIFLVFLALIFISIAAYFSFLGWERITGGKFVDYLNQNKETVGIDDSFSYKIMENDLAENKLILVGESHGFEEPTKFDIDFFKHLYSNFNVRNYFAELDFAQAKLMNEYMETGDESTLQTILQNWIVIQGRNNKDYFDKYRAFHQFYQKLPADDKFKFVGVDRIQDWNTLTIYINYLSETDSTLPPIIFHSETGISDLKNRIQQLIAVDGTDDKLQSELPHLLKNIEYKTAKSRRETVMFQNFSDLYEAYGLSEEKVYGYFGIYHILQYRVNGKHPLASQLRQSDLGLAGKILSMNFLFVDSYMITDSKMLPEFMRDEGEFSKMPVSADNMLLMYIYGIGDFKRTTEEYHKSLVKLNGENNPYSNSNRMNTTFQLLPLTELWEMNDKGKPYTQFTIFVRNSDWAEPIEN